MKVVVRRSQDHNLMITYYSVSIEDNHVSGVRKGFLTINRRYSHNIVNAGVLFTLIHRAMW